MGKRLLVARWKAYWHFVLLFFAFSSKTFAAVLTWKPIGPFGGWVETLAVDPFHPQVIFAGIEKGGIFKSVDRGSSWRASSSGLLSGRIEALVFDRLQPGVMYAATAEGLFKSTDGGSTWFSTGGGLGRPLVNVVAVNPWDSSHFLAGTDEGLFWSGDAGVSWLRVPSWPWRQAVRELTFSPSDPRVVYAASWDAVLKSGDGGWSWHPTGLQGVAVFALLVDARNPNVVYAGGYTGVRKSNDGGETWFVASDGLGLETVWCLAQSPSRPDTLYAGTARGVYKTENAGKSWQRANLGMQGLWVKALAIDPLQPAIVYAGTEEGVYRTTNGGKSWSPSVQGLSASTVDALAIDPSNSRTVYCISRESIYDKAAILKTTDRGRSWTLLRPLDRGSKAVDLLVDPGDSRILYAAVQGFGVLKSEDGGVSFSVKSPIELTYLTAMALDPQDSRRLYVAHGTMVFASFDGGERWEALADVLPEWYERDTWLLVIQALVVHPQMPQVLFAGASNGQIFKSTDGGLTWRLSQLPDERSSVTSIASSATEPQRVFAGSDSGLLVSSDGGESFTYLEGLKNVRIQSVTLVDEPQGIIVVGTLYSGVLASLDGGQTWVSMNAGLTSRSVKKLLAEPHRPLVLLAATEGGGVFELSLANPPRPVLRPQQTGFKR